MHALLETQLLWQPAHLPSCIFNCPVPDSTSLRLDELDGLSPIKNDLPHIRGRYLLLFTENTRFIPVPGFGVCPNPMSIADAVVANEQTIQDEALVAYMKMHMLAKVQRNPRGRADEPWPSVFEDEVNVVLNS